MSQSAVRASALGIAGAYFFLFSLIFWPVVDLASTLFPFRMGDLGWRYGFMGLMASYLNTPILAILLAMGLSYAFRHKITLRILSVFCFIGVLLLFLVTILFPLDVIQIRSVTPVEQLPSLHVGAVLAELKHLTGFAALGLLGFGGWRTAKNMTGKPRSAQKSDLTAEVLKAQKRD